MIQSVSTNDTIIRVPVNAQIIKTPPFGKSERAAIAKITQVQIGLRHRTAEPRRWIGQIRRQAQAAAIRGSNSIEGYVVSVEDAAAVVAGATTSEDSVAIEAVTSYRRAMTYVLQAARDPSFTYSIGLLKVLHFITTEFDLGAHPGLTRPGSIFILNTATGETEYTGPDADLTVPLTDALCQHLNSDSGEPMIDAAMAHLNLLKIHPFKDGNGRMSRILQTLVLARAGTIVPEFASIEEYLGAHTESYYDILRTVGGPDWAPDLDARDWVRYCLNAHHIQATRLTRRLAEAEELWILLDQATTDAGVNDRSVAALHSALMGHRIRNASYVESVSSSTGDQIGKQTATNDLRLLVDHGLLDSLGANRGAHYVASERLLAMRRIRPAKPIADLFD